MWYNNVKSNRVDFSCHFVNCKHDECDAHKVSTSSISEKYGIMNIETDRVATYANHFFQQIDRVLMTERDKEHIPLRHLLLISGQGVDKAFPSRKILRREPGVCKCFRSRFNDRADIW